MNLENARKWLIRSKSEHLKEGDANTKYFRALENGRGNRNTVQKLVINGEDNFCQKDIKQEISSYFQNLFQEKHPIRPQLEESCFTKISEEEKAWAERKIEEVEVKTVIKKFKNNKSPGHQMVTAWNFTKLLGKLLDLISWQ